MMTDEQRRTLVAALEVAIAPPAENRQRSATAYVPWRHVAALRAALEAMGVDWRSVKAQQDARNAEANARADAARRAANVKANAAEELEP
jgi:hypothetical protein